jgi:hypothetical protein
MVGDDSREETKKGLSCPAPGTTGDVALMAGRGVMGITGMTGITGAVNGAGAVAATGMMIGTGCGCGWGCCGAGMV